MKTNPKQNTLPGMLKREMPPTAKVVEIKWTDTPLYKMVIEAENEAKQGKLVKN